MTYQDIINKRRSVYALNHQLPVSEDEVLTRIKDALVASPSAFNMQSAHALILLGEQHKTLWNDIVTKTLQAIVPAENFEPTQQKMNMFAAAYGTVLFFEDDEVVSNMKEQFATYADAFDTFAAHGQGIAHVNVWNSLAEVGVGANLQHYNPIIDDAVRERWSVPANWQLKAQLVFGGIEGAPGTQERMSADERIRIER
ncbi:nitroreductase family protein [Collinsella sp. zg1085]|uniref:nitroreductase family protein n=1 Tax=Collinsella sp. zg1085 TaxID=2844380 RepID=UPI001C0AC754|nr:nitroreductase family protein [Collinsella sp. zg1085]QWT17951.1 nitroreductase family protein [Collinsella sp. zg1085]